MNKLDKFYKRTAKAAASARATLPKVPTGRNGTEIHPAETAGTTVILPEPDAITRVIDAIVRERVRIVVAEDESHLRREKERAALRQAKAKARHKRVLEIIEAIASKTSSWLFVIIYGSVMIVVGINVPKVVVCEHRGDFCYGTRFLGVKAALDDLTPPKTQNKTPDKKH